MTVLLDANTSEALAKGWTSFLSTQRRVYLMHTLCTACYKYMLQVWVLSRTLTAWVDWCKGIHNQFETYIL